VLAHHVVSHECKPSAGTSLTNVAFGGPPCGKLFTTESVKGIVLRAELERAGLLVPCERRQLIGPITLHGGGRHPPGC
jgi:hypothetical protein